MKNYQQKWVAMPFANRLQSDWQWCCHHNLWYFESVSGTSNRLMVYHCIFLHFPLWFYGHPQFVDRPTIQYLLMQWTIPELNGGL